MGDRISIKEPENQETRPVNQSAVENLSVKAQQLAREHKISSNKGSSAQYQSLLKQKAAYLNDAYKQFQSSEDESISSSYAGEWILDNFYIVRRTIRQIQEDLPPDYYRQLPKLENTSFVTLPRVYAIAAEVLAATDATIPMDHIEGFIRAYQQITPLDIGELWAVPTMLRMALLKILVDAIAVILQRPPPSEKEHDHTINLTIEADTAVAHCVTSLRAIENYEWNDFFDRLSLVEEILTTDPARVYSKMDFTSRDRYRKMVETLSKRSGQREVEVARIVVSLAENAHMSDNHNHRSAHVGYWLAGNGFPQLKDRLGYTPQGIQRVATWLVEHPLFTYMGGIILVAGIILLAMYGYAQNAGASLFQLLGVIVFVTIPALTIATALINWLLTRFRKPLIIPKLDFSEEIPGNCGTVVVIPALISSPNDIDHLVRQLEIHYLHNSGENIHFGLLTDFADAASEHRPEDDELLRIARESIDHLNEKHSKENSSSFFLLHRARIWNPKMKVWMGWERKRGKLEEFNRLLLGESETTFIEKAGHIHILPTIQFVITLDADTTLTRGSARKLIGCMAHPLNQAAFDPKTGQVVDGYTILQPRTEIRPVSANYSWFTRIYAGDAGLDLYSRAASDVYQDWFGEGTYVGKGIYNVKDFWRSIHGIIPENTLLSHDLFEGLQGRAGLVTDTVLYEDYPPTYLSYISRMHRWIRGDWQLLPWLIQPLQRKADRSASFETIDRWKILDNLRRSLLAPAVLMLFIAGWFWLPGNSTVWMLFALLTPAVPIFTDILNGVLSELTNTSAASFRQNLRRQVIQWLLVIIFIPFEALIALDAILLTLVRVFFTRQNLLEWVPAAKTSRMALAAGRKMSAVLSEMLHSLLLVILLLFLVIILNPRILPGVFLLLFAWGISPLVAYQISRPIQKPRLKLSEENHQKLHRLARRTWLFFEQFANPEDHWLPPDHFQESPRGQVAHRTSPTNIGLMLTSTLGARDLGYISLDDLILRINNAFSTLHPMERYRGHLLNWYDTLTLEPLRPRYISTVDSGNFIGSVITLKQGLIELLDKPVFVWERWSGLFDTLMVFDEIMETLEGLAPDITTRVRYELNQMQARIQAVQTTPLDWGSPIEQLRQENYKKLEKALLDLVEADLPGVEMSKLQSLRLWSERLSYQLHYLDQEIRIYSQWIFTLQSPPKLILEADENSDISAAWHDLYIALPPFTPVQELPHTARQGLEYLDNLRTLVTASEVGSSKKAEAEEYFLTLGEELETAEKAAADASLEIQTLINQCEAWITETDFKFLFDPQRQIFRIGYNVDTGSLDQNYYDLLASEARIASLIAIAKREVPESHWLHLGRPLTTVGTQRAVLSWSGTMFEYLMPVLHLKQYDNTLLKESCSAAVKHQIQYGQEKGVPWGISESGYYFFDAHENYQYRAFGVPGLGLKRGLEDDLVITPYASILALPYEPNAVIQNMDDLAGHGMLRDYGFYEAVDFTARRLPLGQEKGIVRSFMSHHQGMILLTLVNFLDNDRMVTRFHSDARMQSSELLLQEQIPTLAPLQPPSETNAEPTTAGDTVRRVSPWSVPSQTPYPQAHYISNGNFGSMITNNGSGFLKWKDFDLTRWRADSTLDPYGLWIYIQDEDLDRGWRIGDQPSLEDADNEQITFSPYHAEFIRSTGDIVARMEVFTSPDDDLEIRQIQISNRSEQPRSVQVVSYAEVILAPQSADRRHPVFNTLFIESDYYESLHALHFSRRPRSPQEKRVHLVHSMYIQDGQDGSTSYESDRGAFQGRRGAHSRPPGLFFEPGHQGKTGPVLHPIMSLGKVIQLEPESSVQLAYLTAAAPTRQQALALVRKYQNWATIQRAFDRTLGASELEIRRMELDQVTLQNIQKLVSVMLYPQPTLRASSTTLSANQKGQPSLWPYGISGDFPILLASIQSEEEIPLIAELLSVHAYWRSRNLKIDLVILNEKESGYSQEIQGQLNRLLSRTKSDIWLNQRGGVFVLQRDRVTDEDFLMLTAAARAILYGSQGAVDSQLKNMSQMPGQLPDLIPSGPPAIDVTNPVNRPTDLVFDNGLGGFSSDGREYRIYLVPGQPTPAPWSNVIANDTVGFLITEMGGGYSWSENSGENRLSPWSNDPINDPPGETIYIRDEETGKFWSPTPFIQDGRTPYLVRHGNGYSIFEHNRYGLEHSLRLFAAVEDPVKFAHLVIKNQLDRPRRITVTYYLEWVLGVNRDEMQQYIILNYHSDSGALLARNPYNPEFGENVAFLASNKPTHGLTADRTEFLGRKGSLEQPAALSRMGLSGNIQTGVDPCAVLQVHIDLPPGGSDEVFFLVGQGNNQQHAIELIEKNRPNNRVSQAWQEVIDFWDQTLETVQVDTPDKGMNFMLNRWLLYQDLSCRIWGRSAFYQSSGAFGFRDQLQDTMALIHAQPEVARQHILRAARHQFEEGDVLHWWHPPSGRGVRTRITDDLLWLPFVVAEYVQSTGDQSILAEEVPFLRGKPLEKDEEERYNLWESTSETYTIIEHCHRAIRKGKTRGVHDIPLIGAGDWNDGMNRVGIHGRGESIWLGWFLYATLMAFADLAEQMGDEQKAVDYREDAKKYAEAIDTHSWDGRWYLRGYYDDGSLLGASSNLECKIDAIAQSWSVLSGGGQPNHANQAMLSVWENLVKEQEQLVLLFTPPFDRSPQDPGYIKGYPPGIRENGGQYTHAAIWTTWAFTRLGDGDRAWKLFDMMNPVKHTDTSEKVERYVVEPYVIAADVYSQPPYVGRGGWTWYTGSGGWMYRLGLEAILGFHRNGNTLYVEPCIPKEWPGYKMRYRFQDTWYAIEVENPHGVNRGVIQIVMDGVPSTENGIQLTNDRQNHSITVIMGNSSEEEPTG
jgi:cyclic beta-1,2-glucan synthetase